MWHTVTEGDEAFLESTRAIVVVESSALRQPADLLRTAETGR
jgi:hypothetical protein